MVVIQTYLVEPVYGIAMLGLPLSSESVSSFQLKKKEEKIELPFENLYLKICVSRRDLGNENRQLVFNL